MSEQKDSSSKLKEGIQSAFEKLTSLKDPPLFKDPKPIKDRLYNKAPTDSNSSKSARPKNYSKTVSEELLSPKKNEPPDYVTGTSSILNSLDDTATIGGFRELSG